MVSNQRLPVGVSVFSQYGFEPNLPLLALIADKYPKEALRQAFAPLPRTLTEAPHHIFRKTAQRFVDPYLNRKYTLPYQIAAFEERDSVRVELSYMIPRDRLEENPETGKVRFWDGVFLFDEQWQDVYNDSQIRDFHFAAAEAGTKRRCTTSQRSLVDLAIVVCAPGELLFFGRITGSNIRYN